MVETNENMKECLIVDDSRVVRKVARRIAEDLGFSCREAPDGQEAYNACLDVMPAVILLDWRMPVMNGIEFLEKLNTLENSAKPKIVFCTTENSMEQIQIALEAGADEYIMKPFDSEIIKSKFQQIGLVEQNG